MVIKSRKSKDRQYIDQKKKDKQRQIMTQEIKDRATWTSLKPGVIAGTPEGKVSSSCSTCDPRRFTHYNPGDKSWMIKRMDCDYDKRNISVVICDTDTR